MIINQIINQINRMEKICSIIDKMLNKGETEQISEYLREFAKSHKLKYIDVLDSNIFMIKSNIPSEFNGVIWDKNDWSVMVMPPKSPIKISIEDLSSKKMISKNYGIYPLIDGTMITLYYSSIWRLATCGGFDVRELERFGNTFAYYFHDVLMRCNLKFIEEYAFVCADNVISCNLEKTKSYTFVFTNHKIHPYLKNPENVYLERIVTCGRFPKIIDQILIGISPIFELSKISNIESFLENSGVIFRSKNGKPDMMVETSLFKQIKASFYDSDLLTTSNFKEIIIVNLCRDKIQFVELFPQFKKLVDKFDNLINLLVKAIINRSEEFQKKTNIIIDIFKDVNVNNILKSHNDENEQIISSIIRDYISDEKYKDVYVKLLDKYKFVIDLLS